MRVRGCHHRAILRLAVLGVVLLGLGCEKSKPLPEQPVDYTPAPPASIRRLSRWEFDNAVEDLLGETRRLAESTLPADNLAYGFDNIGSVQSMSSLHVEKLYLVVESIVDAFWERELQSRSWTQCDQWTSPEDCARLAFSRFGRAAWRRPLTTEEVERLAGLVTIALAQGDTVDAGMKLGFQAVLLSPNFLFRPELHPEGDTSPQVRPLSDLEVATRLSFFLWGSVPDEELVAAAAQGRLHTADDIESEARRMIADPKSDRFAEAFFGQWLLFRYVDRADTADQPNDPTHAVSWQSSARQESELVFKKLFRDNATLRTAMLSESTYVDTILADIYGVKPPKDDGFAELPLDDLPRRGFLTQPSILGLTSPFISTSPTRRGFFILQKLLCSPPPPPPANVGGLSDNGMQPGQTYRQRLEIHRDKAECVSCHQTMDPIGFAFENYDISGRWRTERDDLPIDASGALPDGGSFNDALGLIDLLADDARVPACFTDFLMASAIGQGAPRNTFADVADWEQRPELAQMGLQDLVIQVVRHERFRQSLPELEAQ